jgi:hypothetical protein
MRKNYLAVALLISLCLAARAGATTVVYVVTPTGIVVGADGKGFPTGTVLKIVLLRGKYIVADIYAEHVKLTDTGAVLYDFPVWIKQIDQHTHAELSMGRLTEIIKNQMPTTFAFAIKAIETGEFTKGQAVADGVDAYLIQYVIAGYQNGIPTVYSLTLMPDWDTKTVNGPFQGLLKEENGQRADSYIGWRGRGVGIQSAMVADTKEQKELSAKIPVEFLAVGTGKDLTLHQASNVARALLGIEAEANPQYVGFPITVVTIPKIGCGFVRTYKKDVPTLSRLPKGTQGKQTEQPATQN